MRVGRVHVRERRVATRTSRLFEVRARERLRVGRVDATKAGHVNCLQYANDNGCKSEEEDRPEAAGDERFDTSTCTRETEFPRERIGRQLAKLRMISEFASSVTMIATSILILSLPSVISSLVNHD